MQKTLLAAIYSAALVLAAIPASPASAGDADDRARAHKRAGHETAAEHGPKGREAGDCGEFFYWSSKQHKCIDAH
jgi:hypothetical protein